MDLWQFFYNSCKSNNHYEFSQNRGKNSLKKIAVLLCAVSTLAFGACVNTAQVTDAEMDVIAEYAADVLLDHVAGYTPLLNTGEQQEAILLSATPTPRPTATPTPTPTPKPQGSSGGQSSGSDVTPTPYNSENVEFTAEELTNLMNQEGCSFTYTGYEVSDVYLDSSGILPAYAAEGKEFYILYFDVKNETNSKLRVNMLDGMEKSTYEYMLHLNVDKTVKPSFYIVWECLDYLDLELAAKETKQAVLLFEVKKDFAVEKAHLTIIRKDKVDDSDVTQDSSVIIKVK